MLHVRTALRARSLFATSFASGRALPTQWIRLKSDRSSSERWNSNTNPIIRPPLSPRELEYDPKRSLRTSSQLNKENAEGGGRNKDQQLGEFEHGTSPRRNTTAGEQLDPNQPAGRKGSPAQDEFEGPHSSQANTGPDGGPVEMPQVQLPDLRQGIPSTFEAEFLKRSPDTSDPHQPQEKAHRELDITENHTRSAHGAKGGRGGGGEDELPKSAYETSIDRRRNQLANYMYMILAAFGVVGTVYLGRNWETEEEEKAHPDAPSGWGLTLFWDRIKARMSNSLGYYTEPTFPKLLPDMDMRPPYTLVVSLEDLMIHSEWTRQHGWRTAKRPGIDHFLRYLCQYYEIVLFTSMPLASAEPILRKLDPYQIIMWPLFREATRYDNGEYVKDLSYLNRPLSKVILLDTKAVHAKNQPENAIIIPPWKGDPQDKELLGYIPFLEYIAAMGISDVRDAIKSFEGKHIPTEYARREAALREQFKREVAEKKKTKPSLSIGGLLGSTLGMKQQGGLITEEGKSLPDQIHESGMKQYEAMEKQIREQGAEWLKEQAEAEKKAQETQMKSMRSRLNFWGNGEGDDSKPTTASPGGT